MSMIRLTERVEYQDETSGSYVYICSSNRGVQFDNGAAPAGVRGRAGTGDAGRVCDGGDVAETRIGAMMTKWEYLASDDLSTESIKPLGEQGWELIAITQVHGKIIATFKRPLSDPTAEAIAKIAACVGDFA